MMKDQTDQLIDRLKIAEENATILPLTSEEQSILYTLAYQLYRNGKYSDANHFFRYLSIIDSLDSRYWMGLGATHQMLKEYPKAIENYSIAAVLDPNNPYIHWHAAECFDANGQQREWKQAFESALKLAKQSEEHESLAYQLELIQDARIGNKFLQEANHD